MATNNGVDSVIYIPDQQEGATWSHFTMLQETRSNRKVTKGEGFLCNRPINEIPGWTTWLIVQLRMTWCGLNASSHGCHFILWATIKATFKGDKKLF